MTVTLASPEDVGLLLRRWQSASSDFAALMARYGDPVPALRHFGLVQWQAQRPDIAAEAFRAALSLAPDDPRLWSDLAGAYEGFSDTEKAEFCVQRSIDRDPTQSRSWLLLASLKNRKGDPNAAEAAYRRAIGLDPTLADAHFGLGILCFEQRRLDDAAASLRAAVAHDPAHALAQTCLGHVLYNTGDFAACARAFETAARLSPLDANAGRKLARARTFQTMIEGRIDEALAAYPQLAGPHGEDIADISRDAFSLLSAHGHRAAAAEIGRIRLARDPDDPIQRYLLEAVAGHPHTRAPTEYLESYFDRFAPEFDHKLVDVLGYRVPERMADLIARHRDGFGRILDLGCGTGLAAEPLAAFGGALTGVDLSGGMLEEAAKRGRYDELVKAEAVTYLDDNPGSFDLVFAADLLVYIGDLARLVRASARALRPGGILGFSIEAAASGDFSLLPSGRFAHSAAYIRRLTERDFAILDATPAMIRLEASRPVDGSLFVLAKR